jgi:phosphate transport system substrate-binding protein
MNLLHFFKLVLVGTACLSAVPFLRAEKLTLAGHDEALVAIMHLWAKDFAVKNPNLTPIEVVELPAPKAGQGTLDDPVAPPLAPNLLRFGPTAWTISTRERLELVQRNGHPPLELTLGLGAAASKGKPHAIGIFVHPDNPLRRLTLAQIDAAFSADRRRGHAKVTNWGDLGLKGEWANQPIHIMGRRLNNTVSASLREVLMLNGEFKPNYHEAADSVAAVVAVASDRLALGFFGLGFATAEVRAIALAESETSPYIEPNESTVSDAAYALRRDFKLLVDVAHGLPKPGTLTRQFIDYLFSAEAQATLAKEGLYPLPPKLLAVERAKIK